MPKTYSFLHFSPIGAAHVVLNCFLESLQTEKQYRNSMYRQQQTRDETDNSISISNSLGKCVLAAFTDDLQNNTGLKYRKCNKRVHENTFKGLQLPQ